MISHVEVRNQTVDIAKGCDKKAIERNLNSVTENLSVSAVRAKKSRKKSKRSLKEVILIDELVVLQLK